MKRLTTTIKSLALVALFLGVIFITLPNFTFNIGDTNVNYNLADELLIPYDVTFTNFYKGTGLYSTYVVLADYPQDTALDQVNSVYDLVVNRIKTALLTDIVTSIENKDGKYAIRFEFPSYYKDPVQYVKWLVSKGNIYFATAEESPQILDLNDYDIDGSIKSEYSSGYKDHLSFYFSTEKEPLVTSYLSSSQYFIMYIDGAPAMYVLDFDSYIDSNLGRVRAVSSLSLTNADKRQIADYVNIVRSYFNSTELAVSLTANETIEELSPSAKPASLMTIGLVLALITILPCLLLIKSLKIKVIYSRLLWVLIFATLFVGFLKYFGAILSTDLLIGYLAAVFIAQLFIHNWNDIRSPRRVLLGLVLVFGFLTKFYTLNYSVGSISGTIVVGLLAFIISTYYLSLIDFSLNVLKRIFQKVKNISFKRTKSK